jgi:hypothetical protein
MSPRHDNVIRPFVSEQLQRYWPVHPPGCAQMQAQVGVAAHWVGMVLQEYVNGVWGLDPGFSDKQ